MGITEEESTSDSPNLQLVTAVAEHMHRCRYPSHATRREEAGDYNLRLSKHVLNQEIFMPPQVGFLSAQAVRRR